MRFLVGSQFTFAVILSLICCQDAVAQNRGGGGNAFSQLGQTSGVGGQSNFGPAGQSAFGQGGVGGAQGGAQLGGNRNQARVGGQDGFVGSNADQIRNQFPSGRAQRRAMFDFAVESLNEMREARRRRQERNRTPPVRVRLRPLFSVPPTDSVELSSRVRENLDRAMPESAAGTQVTIDGANATIEGSVSNEYDRKLAAKMLSLTPGIYNIENRLTIAPSQTQQ